MRWGDIMFWTVGVATLIAAGVGLNFLYNTVMSPCMSAIYAIIITIANMIGGGTIGYWFGSRDRW